MQDSFTIKQKLTYLEFLCTSLYFLIFVSFRAITIFWTVLISLLVVLSFFMSVNNGLMMIIFYVLPLFVLPLAFVILQSIIAAITFFGMKHFFTDVSYEMNHWGIVRTTPNTHLSKSWRDITKIKETKSLFIICIGRGDFHILQKRMFNDDQSIIDFRSLFQEKLTR